MASKFCGIKVKSPFFLAPMAAITNLSYRLLCKKYGAGMVFTEQINATHLARKPELLIDKKFFPIKTSSMEKPVGIQLFGVNETDFVKAIDLVEKKQEIENFKTNFDLININCGCPSNDIAKTGAGAALLKTPEKMVSIVKACKSVSKKPVTVKMRLGWNKNDSIKISKQLEKANCDAIILHARTAKQGYAEKPDYSAIRRVVESVSIPIVANGNICDGKSAIEVLKKTNTKFALIGRAAIGNPFIFKEINEFAKNKKVWKPTAAEKISGFFEYKKLCEKFGMIDFNDLKQRAIHSTKGISGGVKLREKISCCKKIEQVFDCIAELQNSKGF